VSHIDDLIKQYCPDGVPFRSLGEVLQIKNGKDHKALADGNVPVYGSGGIMRFADAAAAVGPSVLIPRKGSLGNVFYVEGPFWVVDTIFRTEINTSIVEPRFIFHYLLTMRLAEMNQAGGVPSQTQSALSALVIPVPPIEVQREIVSILDTFTQLEAELEAELEARRKQYEHYRNELLSFGPETKWTYLPRISINRDSERKPVRKDARIHGNVPYYGASGVVDFVDENIFDDDLLLISEDGANLLARSTPIAFSVSGPSWVNNHAHVLEFETHVEQRFVEIYLNSIDLGPYVAGGAQPKLNQTNLNKIPIPHPPFEVKARIVSGLDDFHLLLTSISMGLPAEVEARRKQYEYYRDKLLTFKELDVA
jgi:type I restriction enzyme S subunit